MHETSAFTCRRCGRPVGQEILTCPDLPQRRCAFRRVNLIHLRYRVTSALMVVGPGLALIALGAVGLVKAEVTFDNCLLPVVLLFFVVLGMYGSLRTKFAYRDPDARRTWVRLAVLGIPLDRIWMSGRAEPPAVPSLGRAPSFPPSIVRYSQVAAVPRQLAQASATSLFRTALLGLWVCRILTVHQWQVWSAVVRGGPRRRDDVYVFSLAAESGPRPGEGELEGKILKALRLWAAGRSEEARLWQEGPTVYELVRAVYARDVADPAGWVIDLVARDAAGHGLGTRRGWPGKRFEWDPFRLATVGIDQQAVDGWSLELQRTEPKMSHSLDREIDRAIGSRQQRYDWGG